MLAHSPLKLLTPRPPSPHVISIITSSYGGGLVTADNIHLDVRAGPETTLYLATQASTKVYRAQEGPGCRQQLILSAAAGATAVILPDPVAPYADSVFDQHQRFDLDASASLVLLDWFTSGRKAHGERWAMRSYTARNEIRVAGELIMMDALRLDDRGGAIGSPFKMGRFDCFATLVLIGPKLTPFAAECLTRVTAQPIDREASVLFSASPLRSGVVLRLAGDGSESVATWLRSQLKPILSALLGDDPWRRKF